MDYLIKQHRVIYLNEFIQLDAFVKERVSYFELICQLKNISISLTCDTEVGISFNPTKLQRIIDNTISNAIKFSHKNSNIEVTMYKNRNNDIELSFQDYGQGIKNPEKILERYYREDTSKIGFGIGMCIVKSIIDDSDITLVINSKVNEGSRFTYTFNKIMIQDTALANVNL